MLAALAYQACRRLLERRRVAARRRVRLHGRKNANTKSVNNDSGGGVGGISSQTGDVVMSLASFSPLFQACRRRAKRGCRGTQSHGWGRGGVPRRFISPRGPPQAGREGYLPFLSLP